MPDWLFRTPRFEARYWTTPFLAVAEIKRAGAEWSIGVAVDIGKKSTRRQLVTEAIERAGDRIIRELCNV